MHSIHSTFATVFPTCCRFSLGFLARLVRICTSLVNPSGNGLCEQNRVLPRSSCTSIREVVVPNAKIKPSIQNMNQKWQYFIQVVLKIPLHYRFPTTCSLDKNKPIYTPRFFWNFPAPSKDTYNTNPLSVFWDNG